ncbi:tetratricopeptide repeat-containing sensor histidine kinase [Chryseobacterium sp. CT-SW4]|uniref:tetratricopeptide repeat-containing sensor histidine kinase n=1 Tax=Chryseobacterium sp. SW-1 TaxID=3157343 RepID=UPI003B022048
MRYLYFPLIIITVLYSCKGEKQKKTEHHSQSNLYYDLAKHTTNEKEAFKYYNDAKESFLLEKDSLMAGKSLVNMAIIMSNQGDYNGSLQTSIEAVKVLSIKKPDPDNKETQSSNYNCMAIVSESLGQYDKAIEYFHKAIETSNDTIAKLVYLNNIGYSHLLKKDYPTALHYFNLVLNSTESTKDRVEYARVINNYGKASYMINPDFNPIPLYKESLEIREEEKDYIGQNFALACFTDYYENKNSAKAQTYALKRYAVTNKFKNPDDQLEALQKLIILDPDNYLKYFKRFQTINDSTQTARNSAKNQFALIRYETEEKKAENERLTAEKAKDDNFILKQKISIGVLLIVILIVISLYIWRKKTMKREKALEVKNMALRYSKRVHDEVANGIYHVMTEIENQDHINKDRVLNRLEEVYERSRNISYENISPNEEESFNEKVSKLLRTFQNEDRKIFIVGNDSYIWDRLSLSQKEDIFQVIRELMINMKKHSSASQVVFRFTRNENDINLFYSDNGIGIKNQLKPKNGIQNTENRIKSLKGKIIFETQTEKGLKINISFPVS